MSEPNKTMNDFKQHIIEKIKKGEVGMKPKWHFVLKTVLFISGIVLSALLAVYFLSFVFFALHRSGIIFAPGYGMKGLGVLITASPWLLIILAIIFLVTLYVLVKKYSFSYKRPFLYSMLGVLFIVSLVSFMLERVQMHDRIQAFTEKHNIPAAAPFYRAAIENISEEVTYGTIEKVSSQELEVTTNNGERFSVDITNETRQKPGSTYQTGERLLIYGERGDQDRIQAFGIRKVDDEFRKRLHMQNHEGQVSKPLQQRKVPYLR